MEINYFECMCCKKTYEIRDFNHDTYKYSDGAILCKACSVSLPTLKLDPQDVEDIKWMAKTCDSLPMLIQALERHAKVVDAEMSEYYGEY